MKDNYYNFILPLVRDSGGILLEYFGTNIKTSHKGEDLRDIVTDADIKVSRFIERTIRASYPDDQIYSEERVAGTKPIDTTRAYWTIDPIDGTSNFSRNISHFAVCIGYVESNHPSVGAIYNPITRELFSFERGKGAFLNRAKISVLPTRTLADANVLLHIGRRPELAEWGLALQRLLLTSAKKNLNLGSSALDICFVAAGRADASIYGTLTTRDISPALGILREAGGEIYTAEGKPAELSDSPQKVFSCATSELYRDIVAKSK
ncbi:MAG: hypothetical protein A3C79_01925 [Candidatus Taylorbacteria bacterium RIFCSPHIGHO2_02_FULL_45_28]|uniref:Inositol-phosphate phosphatase n=1 Tax=Candidatus Taylorbacteria bacterium RIFCSPHIGHO2_12_FULL_45_16 TaxID=1802315 RepID=A0A1G2N286_9BACT|nr:MAG: hypothetical protein A2830_02730 [Candidatus Taylorbacteria bacterium RIFCSPHIGHO2_01_FULL_44_110]OHA25208.1 MAG: hypothetical protein A3C79_01925 [Candidatus Taylorbacteria bacterium RIFCSPHIGHO2_02_FULL_45_28]OHA29452.1 MAG: hypothetical protein A3F51_00235 [Candidatus Taylorbacteria bacterium RIFCSPHIGHO2_12_FULL_45_16]OHA33214.1 MAG: hypothetical protein A3A23_02765 [Candidatus Taylorbacteria bacterium RIFCSPLOWO2_01_FULL_45_59]OHA38266.1 MAG: hypothetical protein A3I98_03035 [Candi